MAVNLDAIRKRVKELQGGYRSSKIQLWKPGPGTYKIRALPWLDSALKDGQPFVERYFYYIGGSTILAPEQFGKEDPVSDLRVKLYRSGEDSDREIAKNLRAKMRCYLPIVERGKENEGVKIFSFGKLVYTRLLNFFLSEDTDNWTDPKDGFDLEVSITKQDGKKFNDTSVDLARRSTQLADTDVNIKKLLDAIPDIGNMYREKSTEEINKILNDWLHPDEDNDNDGTSRNDSATTVLDDIVNDVKETKEVTPTQDEKQNQKAKAKKVPSSKKKDPLESAPAQSLDAAFEELMDD